VLSQSVSASRHPAPSAPQQSGSGPHVSEVAMQIVTSIVQRFGSREEGQDLLEYGLLAALIALVALGAVQSVGTTINTVFWSAIAAASV
jgi:Flp pilus assembly pilin Flp